MKKLHAAGIVLVFIIIVILTVFVWFRNAERLSALKHETARWAVITDRNGDEIAIEPTNNTIWAQITELYQNSSMRLIGSIVEEYDNKWGFRLRPANITIATVTAEGLQATIKHISEDLDYWLGGWAYITAKVTETHSP